LQDFFENARRYQKAKQAGGPGFKADLKFEAMLPVLERKLPVVITAERERAVREALDFASKQQIRVILSGVREAGDSMDEIVEKKIPIILPETLALPLEEDSLYDSVFSFPGTLYKEGVLFAFASFSDSFSRNLPYQAAAAVPFGLPRDAALRAVTLNPARIWGVDDKLGSIEKGKWADLVLADGDLLEARTNVMRLWIRGREVKLDNRHSELYQRYLNRP
jgi:imidazolonepropionase-like amidohydrolase